MASFHSNSDYDLYFDLIIQYQNHPFGLRFLRCQIGLLDKTSSQGSWIWMDGTPYDWGQLGTNSSHWDDDAYYDNLHCASVRNGLNNRRWRQYDCLDEEEVHCGVCNTPEKRPYLLQLNTTIEIDLGFNTTNYLNRDWLSDMIESGLISSTIVAFWIRLNGTNLNDINNNTNSTIGWHFIEIDLLDLELIDDNTFFNDSYTFFKWNYFNIWDNYTNIGPIQTVTFVLQSELEFNIDLNINFIKLNYFEHSITDNSLILSTNNYIDIDENFNTSINNCSTKTIQIQYWYSNLTITDSANDCDDIFLRLVQTSSPTILPSTYHGSTSSVSSTVETVISTVQPTTTTGEETTTVTGRSTAMSGMSWRVCLFVRIFG